MSSRSIYLFVLSFFPRGVLDEILNLVESVSEGFPSYSLYIACNDRNAFFTSDAVRNYYLWSCRKVCEALTFLLDNIYIRFCSKLYRQILGMEVAADNRLSPAILDQKRLLTTGCH